MNPPVVIFFIGGLAYAAGAVLLILVYADVWYFPVPFEDFCPIGREIDAFIALIAVWIGVVLTTYILEGAPRFCRRTAAWRLLAVLGPVGVAFALVKDRRLFRRDGEDAGLFLPYRSAGPKPRIQAVFLTCVITALTLGSGLAVLAPAGLRSALQSRRVSRNEQLAIRRLRTISAAQHRYRETDWDGDGRKTFALYLAHLWRTVDNKADSVPVNLVPRELAFAMRRTFALDGYFYVDIHYRKTVAEATSAKAFSEERLDRSCEFAVAGFPCDYGESGRLSFLVTGDGVIMAKDLPRIPEDSDVGLFAYPLDPRREGWTVVDDNESLKRLQESFRNDEGEPDR